MGAAVGVIVIAAGFVLGSVMHTSSPSANEPSSSVSIGDTAVDETPVTGNGWNQTSDNGTTAGVGNDQPTADKGSVVDETDETVETVTDEADTDETDNDEGNGLNLDLGVISPGDIPDWLVDPFPLPDELGPIDPPNPIDPRVSVWAELPGHIHEPTSPPTPETEAAPPLPSPRLQSARVSSLDPKLVTPRSIPGPPHAGTKMAPVHA
jgi:hypothetical protein